MNSNQILFLDIETVPQHQSYHELNGRMKTLWDKKAVFVGNLDNQTPEELYQRAGIYAEFGKIISIAVGLLMEKGGQRTLRVKDFSGHDEVKVLRDFNALINTKFKNTEISLCAHNGKEFDFPYLSRRMVIQGIELPSCLQLSGKKPWEVNHIDTMEMWKFGDHKKFTSLELLASVFDIPTSKDDIDGSQVYEVYYTENDLPRIAEYCRRDVAVLAQVYLRLKGLAALNPDNIVWVK